MTTALIFAGGAGHRMNTRARPKQFLEVHGKPVIIYTLEHFQDHPLVDGIVVVCLHDWIRELEEQAKRYGIDKIRHVVSGGATGHDSIYRGLCSMASFAAPEDIVLIHDGVRPLITEALITENIGMAEQYGNAITVEAVRESVVRSSGGRSIDDVPPRDNRYVAKAPQTFRFGEIFDLYQRGQEDGFKSIDSAHLCHNYGMPMHMVRSTRNNLKITEPADYYIFRALQDAMENEQIFGV